MFLHTHGFRLSTILGVAILLAVAVQADDEKPAGVIDDGKRVPTRVETPKPALAVTAREPRVLVRDLRAGCDQPYYYHHVPRHRRDRLLGIPLYSRYGGSYGNIPFGLERSLSDAYHAGRYDEQYDRRRRFNEKDMAQRKERLLSQHEQTLVSGLQLMKEGQYARAVVALTLAAKLNQADPACRIHLAQARLARGHYREAGLALRRALQLQPKLVYADLHLDKYYQDAGELSRYTDTLDEWVRKNAAHPEVHFLLGFLEFQRGNFEAAHTAFQRVKKALPNDDLTQSYCEISKPASSLP